MWLGLDKRTLLFYHGALIQGNNFSKSAILGFKSFLYLDVSHHLTLFHLFYLTSLSTHQVMRT